MLCFVEYSIELLNDFIVDWIEMASFTLHLNTYKLMKKILLFLGLFMSVTAFSQIKSPAQQFFNNLKKHCGNAYEGKNESVSSGGDDAFQGKRLVMHVRSCEENTIRIPFIVGEDRSRTWVLTLKDDRILLKHDHRLEDGAEDEVTQYGGWTTNIGSDTLQMFPADQETRELLPYAGDNVWWITVSETSFSYNLRRIGTDRLFTVVFDLTQEVATPLAPWGSEN